MKSSAQYTEGYTIIEILIGLVIIGLLFAFGYASFRDFSRREALNGIVKQIQGDIRLAQSSAAAGQKPDDVRCNSPEVLDGYGISVSSVNNTYSIEAYCTGSTTPVSIKTVDMPSEVAISNPTPNPIKFKVLGQGTNLTAGASAVITLTQTGTNATRTVTITAGGEVK